MRIAMVSEHASPLAVLGGVDAGGQNVYVAALAAALVQRGHSVVVHTRRDDLRAPRQVRLPSGVVVDHVSAGPPAEVPKDELLPYMDEFAADLARRWRRRPPDLVHAHFWMSGLAALDAARPLGVPVVQTFHALGVVKRRHQGSKDTSPPERLELERRLLEEVDHVIAECTDEVFELVRLGACRDRISVVPGGVDVELFAPGGPTAPRSNRHRLLFFGRLVERKGIGNVISALAAVPDTELVVAGGPEPAVRPIDPGVRRLGELAQREGVLDRVVLLGRVAHADLPPLVRSADVVVSVPWYEQFGIVPLEAMACGVPVVASAVGGHIDSVVDGGTGVLVPPRDPVALAAALRALLADPQRRAALGAAGARRAAEHYSWDRIADATLATYRRVIRHARSVTPEEALP